jgi:hypothetical protein
VSPGRPGQRDAPHFKSSQDQRKFQKKVYNAALEHLDEEDHELFAHFAGDSDNEPEGEDYAGDSGETDDAEDDAMVNAAISLDMLLN